MMDSKETEWDDMCISWRTRVVITPNHVSVVLFWWFIVFSKRKYFITLLLPKTFITVSELVHEVLLKALKTWMSSSCWKLWYGAEHYGWVAETWSRADSRGMPHSLVSTSRITHWKFLGAIIQGLTHNYFFGSVRRISFVRPFKIPFSSYFWFRSSSCSLGCLSALS